MTPDAILRMALCVRWMDDILKYTYDAPPTESSIHSKSDCEESLREFQALRLCTGCSCRSHHPACRAADKILTFMVGELSGIEERDVWIVWKTFKEPLLEVLGHKDVKGEVCCTQHTATLLMVLGQSLVLAAPVIAIQQCDELP
jgi:hypothetical protein